MYQHKFVQKLDELYQKHKSEEGSGLTHFMLKAFAPSIPEILKSLDENEETLQKVNDVMGELMEAMKEDKDTTE